MGGGIGDRQRISRSSIYPERVFGGCAIRAHAVDRRHGTPRYACPGSGDLFCNSAYTGHVAGLGQEGEGVVEGEVFGDGDAAAYEEGYLDLPCICPSERGEGDEGIEREITFTGIYTKVGTYLSTY